MAALEGVRCIHLVGIGGIGMSGIAELLLNQGYVVSGSDLKSSPITDRLEGLGVRVYQGHDAAHLGDADLVVCSAAVGAENPELAEARFRRIPVVSRGSMLAELMEQKSGIAIVGAHGKTTTTSMIALVLEQAGLDPTAVIGGRLSAFGSNARLGRGAYMVVEADESDRSFLELSPQIAVMTNIDQEHVEAYRDFDDLKRAFLQFADRVPASGRVVACVDDPHVREIVPRMARGVTTYGLDSPNADVRAEAIALRADGTSCEVNSSSRGERSRMPLRLNVPGRHNVQNALAAVAVGFEIGLDATQVADALGRFRGADRRFEFKGTAGGVTVIDDYGHHPTEIEAVVATARLQPQQRLVVLFQPHRYTRTMRLLDRFAAALARADVVVLTDIYAASETPIPGVTVEAVAEAIRRVSTVPVHVVKPLDEVAAAVARLVRQGDLVITLGAGSIGRAAEEILRRLSGTEGT